MQRYVAGRLSRIEAFAAQGVTLQDPFHSWSGIRDADGAVVFAMREADVRASADGFCCRLWAPAALTATDLPDREERLRHCRLAMMLGGADGLLVSRDSADVQCGAVLTLNVEKRRNEYWATWGSTVRGTWMAGRAPRRVAALAA
jgi:hypothetical protein